MEEDVNLVTHEQYIEMLIDASFRDASEMESGFTSWCERHVPTWRQQGYDETWIRQRIETAQIIQNSMIWREDSNISTLASFAIEGIRAISGNAIRCEF